MAIWTGFSLGLILMIYQLVNGKNLRMPQIKEIISKL